ncbi:MAG: lysoplasmalogenase [Chitinophagaceae bacterium]|nr:lysoplasmalogenase [Chitinophagaceae bacterium]
MQRSTHRPALLIILFGIVLAANCLFIYLEIEMARQITKALLMPVLIGLVISSSWFSEKRFLFVVLLFSWLGDLLLLGKGQVFFLSGLSCFLLAHLTYIFIFNKLKPLRYLSTKKFIYTAVTPLTIAAVVLNIVWGNLHELKYPVLAYMIVITIMYIAAGNAYDYIEKKNILLLAGAKLFLASDAILAINLFYQKTIIFDVAVMITYGLAQLLLVIGLRSATKNNSESIVYTPG